MTCECKDWGSDGYCRRCGKHFLDRLNELESLARDAMDFISKSPCDPDITNEQTQAWLKLQEHHATIESLRTQDTE